MTTYSDPVTFYGAATFAGAVTLPANSFGDGQASAASPLGVTKVNHQNIKVFAQASGSSVAAETRVFYVAKSAGTVAAVNCGAVVAAIGADTCSLDLRKNGTTILSAAVSLTSSNAAYALVAGSISSASYSAGDVFSVVVTATHSTGTLAQGAFLQAVFQEAP